ncbi:hypothetical protein [Corynebacterium confusum]|uniref:hypothetical protein n=1 Tax=Corynebacterium confusum TaxID=71254 RepID=UPI0025B33C34|nr:hypothetical protein [Corynebacterium confusum]WJY90203.1 hypothetical protein CCONF_08440 [Corynebacterium confusum]
MKKRFKLPVESGSFKLLVKASRPVGPRDFAVLVSNRESDGDKDRSFLTNLVWSSSLHSFYHYSSNTTEAGWVGFRKFKWGFETDDLTIEIKNWKAKDVEGAVEDFRLCLYPDWSMGEMITLQGERVK